MAGCIHVRGAREHNLKNVDVEIPRDSLTVITGLSGSGKSSLAFDTIYAEGQRRYVESLSAYARQFLELMGKPDVDSIEGLSPAISIEQKTTSRNPRSTVGTVTEIHDYMRLLWARAGVPYSPATGLPIEAQTVSQMVDRVMGMQPGTRLLLLAPVVRDRKGEYRKELAELQRKGYTRVKVDGKLYEIGNVPTLNRKVKHEIEAVVDRIVVREGNEQRLADSFETALALADGVVYAEDADSGERTVFSSRFACPVSGFSIEEIEPRLFSFNSPHGACPACDGLGVESFFDPHLVVPDERVCLAEGAIAPWANAQSPYYEQTLQSLARHFKVTSRTAWSDLPAPVREAILFGTGEAPVAMTYKDGVREYTVTKPFEGVIRNLQRRYQETDSAWVREEMSRYQAEKPCAVCLGARLKPESLAVKVAGFNIAEASELSIRRALDWFAGVMPTLTPQRAEIARRILREILDRLSFLVDVGLDYLTLARGSATLSGGESQRIRLASQIGSGLTGVLYVLDEPSIGLHQRDNERLLGTLRRLKALGNTVLVVEHDEDAIRSADHLIDMGPAAGISAASIRWRRSWIAFGYGPICRSVSRSLSRPRCAWAPAWHGSRSWTMPSAPSSCSPTSSRARSATTRSPSSNRGCSPSTVPSAPARPATGSALRTSSIPARSSPTRICRSPGAPCAAGIGAMPTTSRTSNPWRGMQSSTSKPPTRASLRKYRISCCSAAMTNRSNSNTSTARRAEPSSAGMRSRASSRISSGAIARPNRPPCARSSPSTARHGPAPTAKAPASIGPRATRWQGRRR